MKSRFVVETKGMIFTESGELHWKGICGVGGLKIKTWRTRLGAQKVADRFSDLPALGARVVEVT